MNSLTHSPRFALDLARSVQDDLLRQAADRHRAALATAPREPGPVGTPRRRRRPLRAWRRARGLALA